MSTDAWEKSTRRERKRIAALKAPSGGPRTVRRQRANSDDAGPEQKPYGEVSAPETTQAPQEAQPKQLPQGAAGFNSTIQRTRLEWSWLGPFHQARRLAPFGA